MRRHRISRDCSSSGCAWRRRDDRRRRPSVPSSNSLFRRGRGGAGRAVASTAHASRDAVGAGRARCGSRRATLIAAERFRPPRTRDLARALSVPEAAMRATLKRVQRMGRLIEVAPDQFFLSETVAEMAGIAAAIAEADSSRHGDRRGIPRPVGERQEGGDPGTGVLRPRRRHCAHRRRAAGADRSVERVRPRAVARNALRFVALELVGLSGRGCSKPMSLRGARRRSNLSHACAPNFDRDCFVATLLAMT